MRKFVSFFTLLLIWVIAAHAQTSPLTGQVRDEKGDPVPYATVKVKGSNAAAVADANGNFSVSASRGSTITVTAAGFNSFDVAVGNQSSISVSLKPQTNLQEVVVTALGQTRSKAKVGYSTTTFNAETINRTSPVGMLDALAGKVPGADISNVGGPGASTKVVLRGYGVISGGGNQPLYVIDGIPLSNSRLGVNDPKNINVVSDNIDFGNGMNDVNPNDIETITVLKGTAAASLYGSAAKNGAIMITTKRGKSGKLRVEYTGSANFSRVGKLPDFQDQFGQGWDATFILSENGSWGPRVDGKDRLWGAVVDNSQLIKPFTAHKDNIRDFYNTGTEFNNTLSLSGGTEASQFYFSYGNLTSDGVLPSTADYLQRNTFALRTNTKYKNFSIASSFNYVNRKQNAPYTGQGGSDGASTFEELLQIPIDIPITDFRAYRNKYFNVDNYFTPYAENPYYPLHENGNTQNADRFFGNVDMNYKFTNWLTAQFRLGGDFTNARTFGYKAVNAPSPGSWNAGANVEGQSRVADVGSVSELTNYLGVINGDFILKFNKDLSQDFNLEAFVGVNYNQQSTKGFSSQITNLTIPGFYNLSNSSIKPLAFDTRSLRRLLGTYAQVVLGYRNQLYLTLNGRNDWSSTLPINNNSFFYPGANLSWLASQTLNLDKGAISLLKFRASYGQTGSDADPYLVNPTLTVGTLNTANGNITFPFNGVSAFGISNQIGNLNLQPIITTEAEFGTEIRLFKNRLGLDAAYYDKQTKGQIFAVPISPSTGYTTLVQNLGLVDNKGVEISLDVKPIDTKDFVWTMNYNFAKNWSNVVNLTGGPKKTILNSAYDAEFDAIPGMPVGVLYAPVPQYAPDGRIIVNPQTGVPLVAADKGYYGTSQRDYMMGLTNTFSYKGVTLNFSFDYRKGGVMYSGTADLSQFVGNAYTTTYNDRRPFIIPNSVNAVTDAGGKTTYVENTTFITEANYDDYYYPTTNLAEAYQRRIIDKSFLKLRDITLSYALPARWASKIQSTNLTVSVYGRNFLLWTPSSNVYIDPEASNYGNDIRSEFGEFRTAPISRQLGVSLKAAF